MRPLLDAPSFAAPCGYRVAAVTNAVGVPGSQSGRCVEQLARLARVAAVSPSGLAGLLPHAYDLVLDLGGGDYALPAHLYPRAWWAVEGSWDLARCVRRAQFFDWVFVAEEALAVGLREAGVLNAWWVPLAEDPNGCEPEPTEPTAGGGGTYRRRARAVLHTILSTPPYQPRYYSHARPELAALVPEGARRILDVGCGAGALGRLLKQRAHRWVEGVELNTRAAEVAREALDRIHVGDILRVASDLPDSAYDAVVLGDVLEHLTDPPQVLRTLARKLAAGGCLVVSVPNAAHWSLVLPLLQGEWTYVDAGHLDHTHVRFFTPRSAVRLLQATGYRVVEVRAVLLPPGEEVCRLVAEPVGSALWDAWRSQLADVYQVLIRAERWDEP